LGGTGNEAFCAGADISELVHHSSPDGRRAFFESISTLIEAIHRCPHPVIARVHGFALAGGCGLAAACDIVIASDEAVFGLPEVGIGLAPMIVMAPIHRAVGRRALAELVLTGERITAARAFEIGLVTKLLPKSDVDG
jgi:enoyl-CoA hydratase/carnithine racemase